MPRIYFWHWEQSRDEIELTVLPLNGGHAVFVDAAGRKNDWLVNCGNENAVEFTLKPFLRAQGVNKIPRLVLTRRRCAELRRRRVARRTFRRRRIVDQPGPFPLRRLPRTSFPEFEKPSPRIKIMNRGDQPAAGKFCVPTPDE